MIGSGPGSPQNRRPTHRGVIASHLSFKVADTLKCRHTPVLNESEFKRFLDEVNPLSINGPKETMKELGDSTDGEKGYSHSI